MTSLLSTQELAKAIRDLGYWDYDMSTELCERAGLLDEWEASDDMTSESVIFRAADILGVEVL